jgi:hypothetical protein
VFSYLQPLVLATPIALGGLGLDAPTIGLVLGLNGIIMGVFQVIFFAPLHRRFGTKKTFITALSAYFVIYISWPIMSFVAKRTGKLGAPVFVVLVLQQIASAFAGVGYSECFVSMACIHCVFFRTK